MKFTKLAGLLAATAAVAMIGTGAAMADEGGNPISVCIITSSGIDDGSFNRESMTEASTRTATTEFWNSSMHTMTVP